MKMTNRVNRAYKSAKIGSKLKKAKGVKGAVKRSLLSVAKAKRQASQAAKRKQASKYW